jgi:hypothetical protein
MGVFVGKKKDQPRAARGCRAPARSRGASALVGRWPGLEPSIRTGRRHGLLGHPPPKHVFVWGYGYPSSHYADTVYSASLNSLL